MEAVGRQGAVGPECDQVHGGQAVACDIEGLDVHADQVADLLAAIEADAVALGLRTYAMLCPLLPGIANSPEDVDELVRQAVEFHAEEIFVEPVNARAAGLRLCQEALSSQGYQEEAAAIGRIRDTVNWSQYVVDLLATVQRSVRKHSEVSKLRFLLYPSRLLPEHIEAIRKHDAGVIWLGR